MSIIKAKRLDLKETRPLTKERRENSSLNEKEDLSGEVNAKAYPRRLVLEMTSACNIRCKMCGRNAAEFTPTIFKKNWLEIFEPIADKVEEVTLLGWGEPTLHPEFSEFLAWAHDRGLRIYFCTNGIKLKELADDIFKYKVDLINVSLDGADAETNNSIRCGADFDEIIDSVKYLVKRRDEAGLKYPYISFVITLMNSNYKSLPDYVRLAKEVGIEEIKGVYLTVFDDNMVDESLIGKTEELRKIYEETQALGEELNIAVKLPDLEGEDSGGDKPHKNCYVGWCDFFLGSDGYVRSCISTSEKMFNIIKYSSLDEMWNSLNTKNSAPR